MKTPKLKPFSELSPLVKIARFIYVVTLIGFGVIGVWAVIIWVSYYYPEKLENLSLFGQVLFGIAFIMLAGVFGFVGVFSTFFIHKKLFRIEKDKRSKLK
jgi:hypothetical protein